MAKIIWDQVGQRFYETGVDHGVLYLPNSNGSYVTGVAWNGLVTVNETPTGAEANAQYADNIKYLNLFSAENFEATLEAFTYPDEFAQFDGLSTPTPGVTVGQQPRKGFGLSYRTLVGNDLDAQDHGYKLHLVYGCQASASERSYSTVNDSPEPITFSWSLTTTPVAVTGLKPTSILTIDSTKVDPVVLASLEQILYGDAGVDPMLPVPDTVITMFDDGVTVVTPGIPTFVSETNTLTIPGTTGVIYRIAGDVIPAGSVVITENTLVTASPAPGYVFATGIDDDWLYIYTP